MSFAVKFSSPPTFAVALGENEPMRAEFGAYTEVPVAEYYAGEYDITPSSNTQLIEAGGLVALRDFIIRPIPSNYGLITWNGSTLTVS